MNEWQVVGVIIALIGLVGAIVAPLLRLNGSITKLTITVDQLVKDMDEQHRRSHDAHEKLWDHQNEQDSKITDHEIRITKLEDKKGATSATRSNGRKVFSGRKNKLGARQLFHDDWA